MQREVHDHSAVLGRIRVEFPGWGVWLSDTGRWWAFRTAVGALTIGQLRAGCRVLVLADTVGALHSAIAAEVAAAIRNR